MELRFRVWDKNKRQFVRWCGVDDFSLWLLADWMDTLNVVEFTEDFTISQSMGVTDANGLNIFDGDIVEDTGYLVNYIYKLVGVVKPSNKAVGYFIDPILKTDDANELLIVKRQKRYKVIGNIWQNPELLEVGRFKV